MPSKVVSLIGSQCDVVCSFNDKTVTVLWDTGAQVSLVNTSWWKENFPQKEILPLSELLSVPLKVSTANDSLMPFDGYVDCRLSIGGIGPDMVFPLLASRMVSKEKPLIGYNVIEHYMQIGGDDVKNSSRVRASFSGISEDSVHNLVNVLMNNTGDRLWDVRIGRRSEMIWLMQRNVRRPQLVRHSGIPR